MSDARPSPDPVQGFYEAFPFPGQRIADRDGLLLMRRLRGRRPPVGTLLDAGCGTGNTTVALARLLPDAAIVGVDFCDRSLAAARQRAAAMGLRNVTFGTGDLTRPGAASGTFDVVVCLGVLHHTSVMGSVLRNLRLNLAQDGDLYLWVYGRHGRYRHGLNVRLLRLLLDVRDTREDRIALAREFALRTDAGTALRDLAEGGADGTLGGADPTANDAWIADQFLHVRERHLVMEDLFSLAEQAGLALEEWLGVGERPEERLGSPRLRERFAQLGPRERLLALDLLLKPGRYFVRLRHASST